jgi:hypothetical protein
LVITLGLVPEQEEGSIHAIKMVDSCGLCAVVGGLHDGFGAEQRESTYRSADIGCESPAHI